MPRRPRELPYRPGDASYYENRVPLLSQGDIFADVDLNYVGAETAGDGGGTRRFMAAVSPGPAMLITPTCSMRAQGPEGGPVYAHPIRTLVPVVPLTMLVANEVIRRDAENLIRQRDQPVSYMYLPGLEGQFPESCALLYLPVTVGHVSLVRSQRITQLTFEAAAHLQMKLVRFWSGKSFDRANFSPATD
jgi:hypothetical protein